MEADPLIIDDDDDIVIVDDDGQPHRRWEENKREIGAGTDDDGDDDDENEYVDGGGDGYRSVDAVIEALGFGVFQWRLLMLCGMAAFSIALTHAMKTFLMPILKEYWHLSHLHLAVMNSADLMGMIAGSISLGRAADKFGRRPIYLVCLLFSGVFGLLSAFAPNFTTFVMLRSMLGVSFGAGIVINIVLIAEVLPVKDRGYYLAIVSVFHAVGHLLCVAVAWVVIPRLGWRVFIAMTACPPLIVPMFHRYIPESARFALLQDGADANVRAIELLMRIADDNNAPADIKDKLACSVLRRPNVESREAVDLKDFVRLFNHPMLGKVTLMVVLVWFVQSIAGVVVVWLPLYVAENQNLHKQKHGHMHMNKAYAAALLVGIGGLCGTALFTRFMESMDRRRLLAIGYVAITLCAASLSVIHTAAAILAVLPFMAGLKKGLLATLNVYTPEIYPTAVRTTAMGLMNAFQRCAMALGHWLVGALMSKSFTTLALVVCGLYLLSLALVLSLPFDTRGRKLASAYYNRLRKNKRWGCALGC